MKLINVLQPPKIIMDYQDEDGCPDNISSELVFDQDSDSIPDLEDQCPLAPEDFQQL